ncbi:MAG: hypothetical protein K2L48_04230 [Mycoplasmoidaceae bacterium]|nr:hypothetical protein [Mycoplasmoidaceae bacterium]
MGFIVHPLGEIHDSVLWVLAQTLTYSGAIFGVGLYIKSKSEEIKEYINNKNTSNNLDNSE